MELTNTSVTDLGITYDDGDGNTERTVIVRGTVAQTGGEFAAAVLLDGRGKVIDSPASFTVDGVDNFEMACRLAATGHDQADSLCGLLECDCRELAEQAMTTDTDTDTTTYDVRRYHDAEAIGTAELTDEQFRQYMGMAQQPEGLLRLGSLPHAWYELHPDYQAEGEDTTIYLD